MARMAMRAHVETRVEAAPRLGLVADPIVTKEYVEDLGERDADGRYDYAYRFWIYRFELDGRTYQARVYVDDPDEANVLESGMSRLPQYEDDLRAIGAYLNADAGVRTTLTLSPSGGFEPALAFE